MGEKKKGNMVNLFWTGGWDSTFRLLDLILTHHIKVQPHYLIDPNRRSTRLELKAMRKIKEELLKKDARSHEFLFPVKYAEVNSLKENNAITSAYERLVRNVPLGIQYEWMARYCNENGIEEMELSIEQGDSKFNKFIEPLVSKINWDWSSFSYRVDDIHEGEDEYEIFKNFNFPVLHLSRSEMTELSKEKGFFSLLEQTWFCHNPINYKPCGVCVPCITTIKEKQKWRIPLKSRIRYYLYVQTGLRKLRKK